MSADGDYCAFTKAVEHLGDRWSLVIIRELALHNALGFNALADGMPGISRSVLAARLRKLEDLGLIRRDPRAQRGVPGYCLTYAGQELRPVLRGLLAWSERFVPDDPAMVERDPDIVIMWLTQRIDPDSVPERRAVVEFEISGMNAKKGWLVLERGLPVSICIEDPFLSSDRYVYISSDVRAIDRIARGLGSWTEAVADGSVQLFGEPSLVRTLPSWFRAPERLGSAVPVNALA